METPRPLGYWHYAHGAEKSLPRPHDLVLPGWISAGDKKKLVAYLRSGATYETWRGYSDCRFDCGIDDCAMGDRDLTDGVWVWPEGLHHYVDKHDVMLPEEFVAHCRVQAWMIPQDAARRIALSHTLDYSLWIAWAREVGANPRPGGPAKGSPSPR
jgi:hypothetical protein